MATRKHKKPKNKKHTRRCKRTRSNRQRGSGTIMSMRRDYNDNLVAAIRYEKPDKVKKYLGKGANPNTTIKDTHPYIPEWILERGGEPISVIMYVARHITEPTILEPILEDLINAGADQGFQNYTNPLIEAVEWGNFRAVELLLVNGIIDINAYTEMKPPALSYALLNEDVNMVRLLLSNSKRKGDINLIYVMQGVTRSIMGEAIENKENEKTEANTVILNILRGYVREQITMSVEEFANCDKTTDGNVDCGIMMAPINRRNAVNPPPSENGTCFKRETLQQWLRTSKTNPITRAIISDEWINTWYPLGLDEDVDYEVYEEKDPAGGKRKSKRK